MKGFSNVNQADAPVKFERWPKIAKSMASRA